MFQFFYKIRIFLGIFLTAAPAAAIFVASGSFSFQLYFLYTFAFAIPLLGKLMQHLPFPLLQLLLISCTALAPFPADHRISGILLGLACGGILHLSIRSTSFLFSRQNASAQGIFTMALFLLAAVFSLAFSGSAAGLGTAFDRTVILSSFFETAGILLFPKSVCSQDRLPSSSAALFGPGRFRKPCFFTAAVAASMAIAFTMYPQPMPPLLFWSSLLAGSLLMGWFVERKGIFSGCVLLIFLCETPLVCLCFPQNPSVQSAGQILLTAAAGSLPVILAILTYYLYGPVCYAKSYGHLAFCVPAGLICVLPFRSMGQQKEIPLEEPAVCLLFLLILGFFCIFFAWKQRFVILKNT